MTDDLERDPDLIVTSLVHDQVSKTEGHIEALINALALMPEKNQQTEYLTDLMVTLTGNATLIKNLFEENQRFLDVAKKYMESKDS